MKRTPIPRLLPAAVALVAIAAFCPDAAAQKRPVSVDTSNVQVAKRTTKRVGGPPKPAAVMSKYGLIIFGPLIKNAEVRLDGKPVSAKSLEVDVANNRVLVDDVLPGKHELEYDHPDYVLIKKPITVRAGTESLFFLTPEKALSTLEVVTEPGTAVYVGGIPKGETAPDGKLKLTDIPLGTHDIKLVKDTYLEFKDSKLFEFGKVTTLAAKLEPLPSSAEFSELFDINLRRWTVPAGWSLQGGRAVLANSPTLGFPTGVNYRDALMAFHLKLVNDGGAAWAVRARDPNNYYLFYLSGPRGQFPGYFNTYVVKDGKLDLTNPDNSVPVIADIRKGGEYQIELTIQGSLFTHVITPASSGKPAPLAVFKDPNNTFSYGGIGFRTVGTEQFSIDELFVQPPAK